MAFFSVVIPTFNRADLIVTTVRSIQTQTFSDYEIIIVDDGSTDNTQNVVAELKLGQLHYLKTENKERGHARNQGLRFAKGEFVVFLDSDDLWNENHLFVLFEAIKINPICNFFATKYQFLTNDVKTVPSDLKNLQQGFYSYVDLLKGNFLACNFCVRRVNSKMKLFEEERKYSIMEDWMFLMENLRYDRLFLIDNFTVQLRDHTDRSMKSDNRKIIDRKLMATRWIEEHLPLSISEKTLIRGYSFYFCAIHSYLDNSRTQAIRFIFSASRLTGLKFSYLLLFAKVLVGKKWINLLKR